MKGNKLLAIAISSILVVGIAIGVIIGINHKTSIDDDRNALSTASKAIISICTPTDNKKLCVDSLSSVANNASATPADYIKAALKSTMDEVKAAIDKSGIITGEAVNDSPMVKMAADDCKELLQYAIDELQASYSTVGDANLHTVEDRKSELLNWLSAVVTYQETCLDGFTDAGRVDLRNAVSNGILNATKLTDNALSIVTAMADILKSFNVPVNVTATSRRLLEGTENREDGGYPEWLSAADRKLLASKNSAKITPNAVVAKDGSGQFKTIGAALAAYPKNNQGRYVIYVKAGIYDEYVTVEKNQVNVFMYGDGPRKTMVTGNKSNRGGYDTYKTASFSAIGNGFIAKGMGFQNTAGPDGHQAVALRVQSDRSAFYNCRMDGYQDTLYVQTHNQFYRNCVISGTVDFIFGDASAVIQNCLIIARRPNNNQQNTVTAQGRTNPKETTGLVIHNCRIVPEQKLFAERFQIPTFLGRPWKQYSRTVIMESMLGDFIQPAGWMPWAGNFALDTLYYAEYANRGPGANTDRRIKWKGYKVITNRNEALQFTPGPFLQGKMWLQGTGAPFFLGLKQ